MIYMMSIQSFFNTYTDPTNNDYILCDKQLLIKFIKTNKRVHKKPPNIFIMWKNDNTPYIKSFFDDYDSITDWSNQAKIDYYKKKCLPIPKKYGKPKLVELITIKAGILWKHIEQDIKNEYELKRYNAIKLFNYNNILTNHTKIKDTWTGPYHNKELSKKVKKDGKIIPLFRNHTLDEMIDIADNMGNLCGGITKTSNGKYSLRFGELIDKPNVCSWLKKDYVYTKSKRGRPKKQQIYDSESDNEEFLDKNDIEVTPIIYNGIEYYHNYSTNQIFDPNTGDIVGIYDNGIIKFK